MKTNAWRMVFLGLPVLAGLALHVSAAYLEEAEAGGGRGDSSDHMRPHPPVIPPDSEGLPALRRLLAGLDIGEPVFHRGLALFPLVGRSSPAGDLRTLDEAAAGGWLEIREAGAAAIERVEVRNTSDRRVFLMAGELILGGKQNRMVREDVLLGPLGPPVPVPVYCGERGRWADGPETAFRSAGALGDARLRHLGARSEGQDQVWDEIGGRLSAVAAAAPTADYHAVYEDLDTRRRLEEYADALRGGRRLGTLGVVAVAHGRVLGCDVFADGSLLERLWDKIVRSYALEPGLWQVHRREFAPRHPEPWRGLVRDFLAEAARASCLPTGTPGEGRRWVVRGAVEGQALEWSGTVVHAAIFRAGDLRPPAPPIVVPMPRPYETEERERGGQ